MAFFTMAWAAVRDLPRWAHFMMIMIGIVAGFAIWLATHDGLSSSATTLR